MLNHLLENFDGIHPKSKKWAAGGHGGHGGAGRSKIEICPIWCLTQGILGFDATKAPKIDKISCRTAVEAFWGLSAEIVVLEAPRQSREPPNNLRTRPTKSGNLRTTAERSRTLPNTFLALRPAGPPGRCGMPGGAPTHPRSKLAEKAPPNSEILKKSSDFSDLAAILQQIRNFC